MAILNNKFVSVDYVLANLGRSFKTVNWDSNDVLEWCMQLEADMIADVESMAEFIEVRLPVTNKQAKEPCNVHRILDVYQTAGVPGSKVSYSRNGTYINFDSNFNGDSIYINYFGTMIDLNTGVPLILKTHVKACEAYCVQQVFFEKYLNNELNGQQWSVIDQRVTEGLTIATNQSIRFIDRQQLSNINVIRGNMITKIGLTTLYNQGLGE